MHAIPTHISAHKRPMGMSVSSKHVCYHVCHFLINPCTKSSISSGPAVMGRVCVRLVVVVVVAVVVVVVAVAGVVVAALVGR